MIKKLILISLLATAGFTKLSSIQKPETGDTVNLTVENYLVTSDADDTLITEATNSEVQLANQYQVEVRDDNDFGAMFVNGYYKENAIVGSTNKVVVRGTDTTVKNYYATEGESIVFVVDTNDKLIGYKGFVNGSTIDEATLSGWTSELSAPTGYNIDTNLYLDNTAFTAGVTQVSENSILRSKLVYDDSYAVYQVSVFGDNASVNSIEGEGVSAQAVDVNFDKKVKVTSTSENFLYWQVGDQIVSYEKEYTFSVYSDVLLQEITGDDSISPEPVINLYHKESNDDMSSLYICGYEMPAEYTMVEVGMLFGGETYETAAHRVMANQITSNNEFAVKYAEDDSEYHSAYLVYKDSEENISVIYDNGYGYEQLYFWNLDDSANVANLAELMTTTQDGITLSQEGTFYKDSDKDNGIRIGTSGSQLIVTLPDGKFADKVYIGGRQYDEDEMTLKVNSVETSEFTDSFSIDEVSINESNTITIEGGQGRALINYIGFAYSDRDSSQDVREANKIFNMISITDDSVFYEEEALQSTAGDYDVTWTCGGLEITSIDNTDIPETEDVTKVLTASIVMDGVEYTKDITVTLTSRANTLALIKSWILEQETFENLEQITEDLVLPSQYSDSGMSLTWASSNAGITNEGVVTRGETDSTGELQVSVTIAGVVEIAIFDTTVLGSSPVLTIVKTVGFETSEGFTSSTIYSNTTEKSYGVDGSMWNVMEGTPSTTSPISGLQSLQCRDYTTNSVVPYMYTDFAISDAKQVTFDAKNSDDLNIIVQYSSDGGVTWIGDEKFTLSTTATEYTYELPTTIESCQFKFSVDPDSTGTDKARFYLDDVNFYGYV
jgi:hypothetical protein